MLVMCENPNNTDAVAQPVRSLLVVRASKFCSNPRNKNSSGHAVKHKIASVRPGTVFQVSQRGANWMKCTAVPRGIALAQKSSKLPAMYTLQRWLQPML